MAGDEQVEMDAICRMESHTKVYCVKIERYSLTKLLNFGMYIQLSTFDLAGFRWAISFYPNGIWTSDSSFYGRSSNSEFICLYLKLLSETAIAFNVQLEFSLLDPSGRSSPRATKSESCNIDKQGALVGFNKFMEKDDLEASEYLKDDCLTVKCKLTVVKPFCVDAIKKRVIVPSSDLHQHFGGLLETREGADITIKINEETFIAHKYVLAARSPVFKAQFFGSMMESKMASLKIEDVRADVFKVLLQFIYTDMLPTEVVSYEMAQHLLVAADRYWLERLRMLCEKKLCDSLDVQTVANTLVLAEQHNCLQLKDVCINFMASRNVLDAVMETDGFEDLMSCRPLLLKEILDKVHSSRKI